MSARTQTQTQTQSADYGPESAAMAAYLRAGEAKAHALGNRGPIRRDGDGNIHPDIL